MQRTDVNSSNQIGWQARVGNASSLAQAHFLAIWRSCARDADRLARLQNMLIALLVFWSLVSASQLVWVPFRTHDIETASGMVLNPPTRLLQNKVVEIDISSVIGSGLFGGAPDMLVSDPDVTVATNDREGIEQNAKETRLALTLTGIIAFSGDGLGSAVIKSGSVEQVYAVNDKLPASGEVALAKVMPQQVVIDNNGTYELIKLYEGPGVIIPVRPSGPSAAPKPVSRLERDAAASGSPTRNALAGDYRDKLYDNPESLAAAVTVAPVREGDRIVGYRIAPGADPTAFEVLGFESGDIVTAVNGLALGDASNTIKLYQFMRDADEATFDIKRGGGTVTISVDLASP